MYFHSYFLFSLKIKIKNTQIKCHLKDQNENFKNIRIKIKLLKFNISKYNF